MIHDESFPAADIERMHCYASCPLQGLVWYECRRHVTLVICLVRNRHEFLGYIYIYIYTEKRETGSFDFVQM